MPSREPGESDALTRHAAAGKIRNHTDRPKSGPQANLGRMTEGVRPSPQGIRPIP